MSVAYACLALSAVVQGASLSYAMRLELGEPVGVDEAYGALVSLHGLVMIFAYLMPLLYGVLGNQLQAHAAGLSDLVYPRLNAVALRALASSLAMLAAVTCVVHGLACGWTLYPPVSLTRWAELAAVSLHVAGISSVLTSLNLALSSHAELPEAGLSDQRDRSLLRASINTGNVLVVLALPVLAGALTMLLLDRLDTTGFFR